MNAQCATAATPRIDVSVITPTFRREREVVAAVHSVLAQQGVSVEMIVLDDSPEHSARAAVERICDPRVRYVGRDNPSGGRPAVVRNQGAAMITGRYACFLDDDDQVLPGAFRSMVAALDSTPRAGVAIARVVSFGKDAHILAANDRWARRAAATAARTSGSQRLATAALLFGECFTSACLIRREHIAAVGGYDPVVPLFEDVEFYARVIRRFGHVFVDHPMLYRRIGESSLTHDSRHDRAPVRMAYEIMRRKYRRDYGLLEFAALRVVGTLLFRPPAAA